MRRIKMTLSYVVPAWNFCNYDTSNTSKEVCRFCEKTKKGHHCVLYDADLMSDGNLISKVKGCCRATAGYDTVVTYEAPQAPAQNQAPAVDPKWIMQETLKMYNKSLNDLLAQGYPRPMAEKLAQQYVLGGK